MLNFKKGNIVKCEAEAIVNSVNTLGVMGKGIALAFKDAFPENFKIYEKACKEGTINIGKLLITDTGKLFPKYIINFPTKTNWRFPSKYEYIEKGLDDLIRIIKEKNIKSIAIPPLGAGNGKLAWDKVKNIISEYLKNISNDIDIIIFEPGFNDQHIQNEKQLELTPARAIFIYLLKNYQILGYEINLLVAQKIAYFIQRLGEDLNLSFEKGTYGPYSHQLTHLMKLLNYAYIKYNENSSSPNTIVEIYSHKYPDVENYIDKELNKEQKKRARKLIEFIEGFESPFGLEVLATVDFISKETKKKKLQDIQSEIYNWTKRKREIMKPHHIEIAFDRLKKYKFI
ncbi:MAG: macro domain-containing protein [FCB group bacterium]|jgi:O-acetyl-ADP-ribose deacetylase (regulator of RNase III)/uncharacterized protein YwgA